MQQPSAKAQGFTLVEIAIVLVIIGLLLGGVLKGQELIDNGRVKNAVSDLNGVISAYNAYVDRFRRIPGDDGPVATLQGRGGNWPNITVGGNGNGILAATAASTFTGGDEQAAFWQHLKAAGFIAGNAADAGAAALPPNAFGGLTGITTDAVQGMAGTKVCLSRVPGKAARSIDTQLDDGITATGSLRATLQAAAGGHTEPGNVVAAADGYSDDNLYTICRSL